MKDERDLGKKAPAQGDPPDIDQEIGDEDSDDTESGDVDEEELPAESDAQRQRGETKGAS